MAYAGTGQEPKLYLTEGNYVNAHAQSVYIIPNQLSDLARNGGNVSVDYISEQDCALDIKEPVSLKIAATSF